jgi:CheY-like chemotaxis protein
LAKKTVLVVEDHPGEWDMYGRILWYNGFHVIVAEDGQTGLQLARDRKPDLIMLDLELPLLHGLELCSQLKQDESTREIPIVALTGRRLSELGGNSTVLGYARFLEKPMPPLRVLQIVEELIGRPTREQVEEPSRPEIHRSAANESAVDGSVGAESPTVIADPAPVIEVASEPEPDRYPLFAAALQEHRSEILERWVRLGRDEPWFSLPVADRLTTLSAVLEAVVEAALQHPGEDAARLRIVQAAVEHGWTRRASGIPESSVPIEFHLLRQAIWRQLTETFPPTEEIYAAIRALDDAITIALNSAMWGYFRDEIEAQGRWQAALERLAENPATDLERERRARDHSRV